MNKIEKWQEEFDFLDENDRLMYMIDLAKDVTSLPRELRTDDSLNVYFVFLLRRYSLS